MGWPRDNDWVRVEGFFLNMSCIVSLDDLGFESDNISTLLQQLYLLFHSPSLPVDQKDTEPFSGWSYYLFLRALEGVSNLNFPIASLVLTAAVTASRLPSFSSQALLPF